MIIWQKTQAGTIREENQDFLLAREDQGIVILANGCGPAGREAAELIAESLAEKLWKIRLQANVEPTADRIRQAIVEVNSHMKDLWVNRPGFKSTWVDLGVITVVEGNLFLAATGTSGLIGSVNQAMVKIDPLGIPALTASMESSVTVAAPEPGADQAVRIAGPLPLKVGDWVMGFTEGLLVSQPLSEIEPLFSLIQSDSDLTASGLFARASQRYDGDDRTLALIRFLPQDLKWLQSRDEVLETHTDRTFAVPIWAALLTTIAGVALLYFIYPLLSYFSDED